MSKNKTLKFVILYSLIILKKSLKGGSGLTKCVLSVQRLHILQLHVWVSSG